MTGLKQWAKCSWGSAAVPALTLLVSFPGQGHGIVGTVGAKDWAGGFLDLKADLQDDMFVGNEPLTQEVKEGYLGEYFSFMLSSFTFRGQSITWANFQKINESN